MIKSIRTIMKQDKERYKVPRKVQDVIPIRRIWPDGIFQVGSKFTKMYRFTDINYLVASREDKESMFLTYSELLNSLDSGATTKLTIYNHRQNRASFEKSILMPMKEDGLDQYRKEYNQKVKRYICELQDVRYILYEPFKSAEDAAAFIRTILKEHHVHIKTAAADDIALCREKYNLLKRRKLR